MNKTLLSMLVVLAAVVPIVSCGSSSSSTKTSGLKFRVFISNPLFPNGSGGTPVVNIVDAAKDALSFSRIALAGNSNQPGLMALSPSLQFTMIFSPAGNSITLIDNTTEGIALTTTGNVSTAVPTITLPGSTESMAIGNDNATGYAAVPTATITGQAPGAVEVMDLLHGSIKTSIPVPGAHFLVLSPDGNHILVFSDNSNTVTVIATILIGTHSDPRSYITGFDHPAWGVFSDNSSAYVLNCGPECGGIGAGVGLLAGFPDPGTTIPFGGTTIPVSGATRGLLSGSILYVAGTPPGTACGGGTAATTCGTLSMIDTGSAAVSGSAVITDGRHDRMEISDNGQLFIGAHDCTNLDVTNGEVRGCLSIFNPSSSVVVVPPQTGDVTGIQPIRGRNVAYVIQNRGLYIYDTTTNQLQTTQVDIVGDAIDVKLVN